MIWSWKDVLLVIALSPLIVLALVLRHAHRWFGPRVIWVPHLIAGIFNWPGYTTSYDVDWRISPKWGGFTPARIEKHAKKRKRVPPHDFGECMICCHGKPFCDEGQAYMDDHD